MGIFGTVTSKGQTTIPKEVRDQLGIGEGSRIEWRVEKGKATMVPRKRRLADMFGMLGKPPKGGGKSLREIDQEVREAVARHVRGQDEDDLP
jgi:AbrB family looped-hinge helix DNA binding protein